MCQCNGMWENVQLFSDTGRVVNIEVINHWMEEITAHTYMY